MSCAPRHSFYCYFCKTKFIKWKWLLSPRLLTPQFFTIQLDRSASLCCQLLPDFVSLACCSAHRGRLEVCSRRGIEYGSKAVQSRSHETSLSDLAGFVGFNFGPVDASKSEARAQWAQQCSSICFLRSECMGTQTWPNRWTDVHFFTKIDRRCDD